MEIKSDSSDLKKSSNKVKKRKGKDELINDILARTQTQIRIKKEPVSEDQSVKRSSTNTPLKSNDKVKSRKQSALNKQDLISQLVSLHTKGLISKKKRKSHSDSLDLSFDLPTPKKIKVEKSSDNETHVFTSPNVKHKPKYDSSVSEKSNKSLRDTPVKVKKEKDISDINLLKERNILENLFSKSDNRKSVNELPNRHSKGKQANNESIGNRHAIAKSKGSKPENRHTKFKFNNDSESSSEDATELPKPKIKTEWQSSKVLNRTSLNNVSRVPNSQITQTDDSPGDEIQSPKLKQQTIAKTLTKTKKVPLPMKIKAEPLSSSSSASEAELSGHKPTNIENSDNLFPRKSNVQNNEQISMHTRSESSDSDSEPTSSKSTEQKKKWRKRLESVKVSNAGKELVSTSASSSSDNDSSLSDIVQLKEGHGTQKSPKNKVKTPIKESGVKSFLQKMPLGSQRQSTSSSSKKNKTSSRSSSEVSDEEENNDSQKSLSVENSSKLKVPKQKSQHGTVEMSKASTFKKKPVLVSKLPDEDKDTKRSSGSDDDVPLPKLEKVKTETVTVPRPIGKHSDSDGSSEDEMSSATTFANEDLEPGSSSEEEVPVLKPQKIKKQLVLAKSKNKLVSVPLPIQLKKQESDSDSGSEDKAATTKKGSRKSLSVENSSKLKVPKQKSQHGTLEMSKASTFKKKPVLVSKMPDEDKDTKSSSGSDDDVPLPKIEKVKTETVTVPRPIGKHSDSDGSSEDEMSSLNQNSIKATTFANEDLEPGSSSEEEVPVLKPHKIKKQFVLAKSKNKLVSVPLPIQLKKQESDSDSGSEDEAATTKKGSRKSLSVENSSKLKVPKQKSQHGTLEMSKASTFKKKPVLVSKMPDEDKDTKSSSGSDDDVPLPKIEKVKTETVTVPRPIGKHSYSDGSSEDEMSSLNQNSIKATTFANEDLETGSSSEEEVPVPKPQKIKKQLVLAESKNKLVSVPLPIQLNQQESDSDSGSEDEAATTKKESRKHSAIKKEVSEKDTSSEEEMPLPKPQQLKTEAAKLSNSKKQQDPIPIKLNKQLSGSESSSVNKFPRINRLPKTATTVTNQGSDAVSTSDEEVPKPEKVKLDDSRLAKFRKNRVPVAEPVYSESSSEDELAAINKVTNRENLHAVGEDSETDSSSDEEVPVPNHEEIKSKVPNTSKTAVLGKKSVSVPLPIKNVKSTSNSEQTSSEDKAFKMPNQEAQVSRQDLQSESNSEDDMPLPKKPKLESNFSVTSNGKPRAHPDSDESMDSDHENAKINTTKEREKSDSSWKERLQYKGMHWTEKLTHRFPGIEKQTINTRLPTANTTYSLLLLPKKIDPRRLVDLKCYFNKESVVSLGNKEYIFEPLPKKPEPVVVNLNGPQLIELQSIISFQQFIPQLVLKELKVPKRKDISLPSALKMRHPLFGVTYKQKLSLGKSVKRKLQEAMENKRKVEEKERKKKRKRNNRVQNVEESVLNIFDSIDSKPNSEELDTSQNSLAEESPKKKKRKSENTFDESLEVPKKKKKKKHA